MTTKTTAQVPQKAIKDEKEAVHGLSACKCGCGQMVPKFKNRNGRVKEFYSDKCRTRYTSSARDLGRSVLDGKAQIRDISLLAVRRERQEHIDLDIMTAQERLGALCRAAEKIGVLK